MNRSPRSVRNSLLVGGFMEAAGIEPAETFRGFFSRARRRRSVSTRTVRRPRFLRSRYLTAGILAGIVIASVGLGRAHGEFKQVPHWWVAQALCVHDGYTHSARPPFRRLADVSGTGEGSWRDPNGPYYGGMQMDYGFMRHHGGWMLKHFGTADHWSPRAQLIVAYRGWRSQGWGAWPTTSQKCGLRR